MPDTEPAPDKKNTAFDRTLASTLRLSPEEAKLILRIRQAREGLFFVVVGSGTIVSMARLAPELLNLN